MKKILFVPLVSLLFSFPASAEFYGKAALKVIDKGKILHSEKKKNLSWEFLVSYKSSVWWCVIVQAKIACHEINIEN